MNTTTSTFAAEIAPYFTKNLADGLSATDALDAAVLQWKADEDAAFARRLGMAHLFAGTYDEFRAERVA